MPASLLDLLVNPNDCRVAHQIFLCGGNSGRHSGRHSHVPMFGLALVSLGFAKFFQSELPAAQALIGDKRVLAWKNPSSSYPEILLHSVYKKPPLKWDAKRFTNGPLKNLCEFEKKQIFDTFEEELQNEFIRRGVLMNSFGVVFNCCNEENGLAKKIFDALRPKIAATLESIQCVVQKMSEVYAKPLTKGGDTFILEYFKISHHVYTITVADATDDFFKQFGRLGSLLYNQQAIHNLCCIKDAEKLQYRADRCVPEDRLFEQFKKEDSISNSLATIHGLQEYVPQTRYDLKIHESKVDGIKSPLAKQINALVEDPSFIDRKLLPFVQRFEQIAAFAFLWPSILSKIAFFIREIARGKHFIRNLGTWVRNQFDSGACTIDDRMLENLICWVMEDACLSDVSKLHATLKDWRFSEFEEFVKKKDYAPKEEAEILQRGKKRARE